MAVEPTVLRRDGISYVRIPAADPGRLAAFYAAVFDWEVDPDRGRFTDGSGHVIGHFVSDIDVAGEAGVRPYICVADVDHTLAKLASLGGSMVIAPYPEGNLKVAAFRDPAGNVIGVWQLAP
ncbi:MAG TPA: VOC family protein [Solirubrobacteraceae bacterium]|nr:VOC family protein [Solirubrobacteraceae bacterium]